MKLEKTKLMKEAENSKTSKSLFLQLLCFLGILIVVSIIESLPLIPKMLDMLQNVFTNPDSLQQVVENFNSALLSDTNYMITTLFFKFGWILIPILYCKFIEKRSLFSMGFVKKHFVLKYLGGLLVGLLLFSAIIFTTVALKGMEFNGLNSNISIGIIILFFLGYAIQGMGEEVACRGFLMNSIGGKRSIILAVITSSIVFALIHSFNTGLSLLAFFNLFLFGVFAAVFMICFENIWSIGAIHTIWNFAQGLIYGITVSGIISGDNSIFSVTSVEGKELLNGGAFGAEGGIVVTGFLLLGICILLIYKKVKKNKEIKK